MSNTRASPPSAGSVTGMPGNTTTSSKETSLRGAMRARLRRILDDVNYRLNQVYCRVMKPASPHACDAWQLLIRLFFAQRAHLPPLAAELQLSPAQCHGLHLIEPGRPIPMGQLAETLACDASNVTGLVDRLESRGLVRRRASAEDRRVKVLDLTPTGSRLRAQLLERMTAQEHPLSRLSPRDRRALVRILERLVGDQTARAPT